MEVSDQIHAPTALRLGKSSRWVGPREILDDVKKKIMPFPLPVTELRPSSPSLHRLSYPKISKLHKSYTIRKTTRAKEEWT
jgi:hypothetical protein